MSNLHCDQLRGLGNNAATGSSRKLPKSPHQRCVLQQLVWSHSLRQHDRGNDSCLPQTRKRLLLRAILEHLTIGLALKFTHSIDS